MAIDYNIPPPSREENTNTMFFWPVLILIIGTLISTGYQIVAMQEQLSSLTDAVAQMDPKVRQAQYEKNKLFKLASDVLQLAATDPNARQIAADYKIEQRSPSQPSGAFTAPSSPPTAK